MIPSCRPMRLRFFPATDDVARRGRLGTLAFELGGLCFEGVQLRRSASGRVYVSLRHAKVRPASDAARVALEVAVLAALRIRPPEDAGP